MRKPSKKNLTKSRGLTKPLLFIIRIKYIPFIEGVGSIYFYFAKNTFLIMKGVDIMFTKWEKIALIIAGIEVIVIEIGLYAMKRSIASKYGVSVKDLKNINAVDERRKLEKKEA